MGTIIGVGGTPNNNTQGGGDSPSTELIDVNSTGISFAGTDFTKSNILEKYDFSNVAYPNQCTKWVLQLQGIAEDADNFYEMYASSLSSPTGMFQGCVLRFTDIKNILIQADYTKLKDIYRLFAESWIIVDDTTTITQLKQGLPLFDTISNYINNGPQRIFGDTLEDATIIIVDPSSTIESVTVIGNINVVEGTSFEGDHILGDMTIARVPSLDITGMQAIVPLNIKYKNIDITHIGEVYNNVLSYSRNSDIIEIGDIVTPDGGLALAMITSSVIKVGNITTELISNHINPFATWGSVVEVGKFPKIVYNSLHMENIENFSSETLEKLFNDTANQGLQAPTGGGTLYVSQTINNRMTQAQRDNLISLGYSISVSS